MAILIRKYAAIGRLFFIIQMNDWSISGKNIFPCSNFCRKKIEEGFCQQEFQQYMRKEGKNLAFFRDEHLVDVWDRYDRPAYQKIWKKGNREILFIVTKQRGEMRMSVDMNL